MVLSRGRVGVVDSSVVVVDSSVVVVLVIPCRPPNQRRNPNPICCQTQTQSLDFYHYDSVRKGVVLVAVAVVLVVVVVVVVVVVPPLARCSF